MPIPAIELRQLDPTIWKACAGTSVQIPEVHSKVYYFPQGHLEQSSTLPVVSHTVSSTPCILCRILNVQFLANPETDEVFVKVRLEPIRRELSSLISTSQSSELGRKQDDDDEEELEIASFTKILTPSDANNGGGFSVPRFCADSIFPPLNYQADPPVQTLSVTDVHGAVFEFRHIYRGTPRRHLLTTGWSKFVNHKKLIAGDSVVFMKNQSGELFVGIRRALKSTGDSARWNCQSLQVGGVRLQVEDNGGEEGFWRSGKGRVSAESVMEAAELAAHGMPFEIVYYPRAGSSDFVVKAEVVEESLNVCWTPGVRVKMAMESEDSSKTTWLQGQVTSAMIPDNGQWRGSPWRMLQIAWDEPEIMQHAKRVSPWQVECVMSTPFLQSPYPPAKRSRVPQNSDVGGELFPIPGFTEKMMGEFSPSFFNFKTPPVGMQGARHDLYCVSGLANLTNEDTNPHHMRTDGYFGNMVVPKLRNLTTELNIGSSQSDNLSPDSQSSVHSFNTELDGKGINKSGKVSIRLFGKIIYMNDDEDEDGSKGEADLTSTYPYMKLIDQLDVVQTESGLSTDEACPF